MISATQSQSVFNLIYTFVSKFKIADEVIIPKKAIVFQKQKPTDETLAKELKAVSTANKNRTVELIDAYNESNRGEEFLKEYVHGLEEMMFMTHHKVRQPVANILGMAGLIDQYSNSPKTLKTIAIYMKQSALDLDMFTRELTAFISDLEQKGKRK